MLDKSFLRGGGGGYENRDEPRWGERWKEEEEAEEEEEKKWIYNDLPRGYRAVAILMVIARRSGMPWREAIFQGRLGGNT